MDKEFYVTNHDGEKSKWSPNRIKETILNETDLTEEKAEKIKTRIQRKINRLREEGLTEITTTDIRSEVSSQLLKEAEFEAVKQNRKLGMSVTEFENLLQEGCKDNANMDYNPEMIAKYAYDSIAKQYALQDMPQDCAEAHIEGYVHHHDLEYFHTRPNCLSGRNNIIIMDKNNIVTYVRIDDFVKHYDFTEYKVPTINIKTNELEWKPIQNAYVSGIEDTYYIKFNKGLSIETTIDHKFIKSHNNKACEDYDIKVNEFLNYKDLRLLNNTNIKHTNETLDYYKSALFGFFLGDGTINKNNGHVIFLVSKERKREYLEYLLNKLDYKYTYTVNKNKQYKNGLSHRFYIKDLIYPLKSKSELIQEYKEKINYTGLLEGLINSDGCIILTDTNKIRLNFTNTNKNIFDLYQLALISHGIRGSYHTRNPNNPKHNTSYNSSSFGENLIKLLKQIKLTGIYKEYLEKADHNVKKYKDISELQFKSLEYTGKQEVYNLTIKDNHNYMAGVNGFLLTQNCMNFDLRFFAKNGLKIDGKGVMGSVAKPAKSLEVLLNHLLQAFMAGATTFSGGQGYVNFNTLLAPYAKDRTYKDIKQALQGFIYNCNMSLVCRGGQILFSNLGIDLSCPPVLRDEPAICPQGVIKGTYKDYQEEADLIFRALLEISEEKDGIGAYHRFPNLMFNIRKGDLDKYEGNCKLLHEKGANNPTLYYVNCQEMERTLMGCRTALPVNYTGNYEKDSMNTGNFMYSTLNLPLIALESENLKDFYKKLDYYCEIIYKTLKYRRECVIDTIYNKHMSDFLLQKDIETGEPLWDIDRTTITIGFCGLHECLQELNQENNQKLGIQIIEYINKKKTEFNNRDGLRWSVIASPAESASHRFATINREKYPQAHVQGTRNSYYLTNSSHIPVKTENNIIDHIRNAQTYHPLTLGGNLLHIWNGEVWSDPKAIWSLNKKILETGTIYWAYSKVFTHCPECGYTINDNLTECPICKSKNLYVYDRITGYYLCTKTFNNGKLQEFKDRYRQKITEKTNYN